MSNTVSPLISCTAGDSPGLMNKVPKRSVSRWRHREHTDGMKLSLALRISAHSAPNPAAITSEITTLVRNRRDPEAEFQYCTFFLTVAICHWAVFVSDFIAFRSSSEKKKHLITVELEEE